VKAQSFRRQAGTAQLDHRWTYALAGCLLVVLPAALVTFPPITDLPQVLAQVPLAGEALSGSAPDYRVQWLTPNKLSYLLLAAVWMVLPPLAAARLATALVAAVWVLALHWLAARRRRSVAAVSLAGVLLFNHVFYLGMFNFLVGLAVFVYWFETLDRERAEQQSFSQTALACGVGGLLLYLAHALWLIAGLGWLALITLWDRRPLRWHLAAAVGLAPTLALVLLWSPSLAGAGWGSVSSYGPSVVTRLSFAGLTNATLGGLTGWLEPLTMLGLFTWIGLGLWQHRRTLAETVDRRLLAAALLFLLIAILLPDKIDRTLRFASRWMPIGWALLLLALPAPALRPALRRVLAIAALAAFCCTTTTIWRGFERHELRGLEAALEALPPKPTLLGLDFVRASPRIKNPVYMHLPAYAQLLHGGRLGFSFVSLASSPVVKRDLALPDPWSPGLEWAPQLLRSTDLEYFDFALVHAPPDLTAGFMAQESRLTPLTAEAPWRLFSIADHPAAAAP
jgi:hypothetical protein